MAKSAKHAKGSNKELRVVDALSNWYALNDALRYCSEREARKLLEAEQGGKRRGRFMKRIHSRLNRVRADRERGELEQRAVDRRMAS